MQVRAMDRAVFEDGRTAPAGMRQARLIDRYGFTD
jgi:hypothetical protein